MASARQIGPFEILDRLGAGGMGEVFKARDTRLNRFVAIKFLPEGANGAARERFQREALAIAALNHPYICTLYEAGDDRGQPFLVMELLEGETLHARLARGHASAGEVIQWGMEIADALQAAHAKGILHRDLKPGNIFVTPRGTVKVLDFGLAQIVQSAAANEDAPTAMAGPLTSPGSTLGTYAYMSPEQARGEASCGMGDARSDIFSLGAVLYEAATGKPAFSGRTPADLNAAVLTFTPPPAGTGRLDDVIARCLEKDPGLRYQSAADLHSDLKRLQASGSSLSAAVAAPAARPPRRRWLWPVIAAVVLAAAAVSWRELRAPAGPPSLQFHQLTFNGQVQDAALSSDGKFLAYLETSPQGTSLHLLSSANGSDVQIMPPGAGCCKDPAFSPDGSQIYFVSGLTLQAMPVLGGAARTIATNVCSGAGFAPDGGRIAYLTRGQGGDVLTVAEADGTRAQVLNRPYPAGFDGSPCWVNGTAGPDAPAWSPDGRWIAVDRGSVSGSDNIAVIAAADGQARTLAPSLVAGATDLAWLPDGSGILLTASLPVGALSQLWEVTFPGGKLAQLTHDLQGYGEVSVAALAGAAALVHDNPEYSVWMQTEPGGAFQAVPGGGADQDGAKGLAWTPDGRVVSIHTPGGKSQLWIEGGATPAQMLPINNLPAVIHNISAGPSGVIVFGGSDNETVYRAWKVDANGTNLTELAPDMVLGHLGPLVEGGTAVAVQRNEVAGGAELQRVWVVPLAGGTPRLVSPTQIHAALLLAVPGGNRVLVDTPSKAHIEEIPLDGSPPQPLPVVWPKLAAAHARGPYALTPDGRALTAVVTQGSDSNLWAFPLDGGAAYQITHFPDLRIAAYAFAPDGRLAISRGTPNSDAVLATGFKP